jgi:hypothetical protein
VFTDVDCPYCKQFHKQIAAYNAAGISVNYVLFPLDIHPAPKRKPRRSGAPPIARPPTRRR